MVSVVFDVDGTLFEKDHILEIYKELGLEKKAREIHNQYVKGEISHKELWKRGTKLLKGTSKKRLLDISKKIEPRSDVKESILRLSDKGYDVYALTDGFVDFIEGKLPCRVYGKSLKYLNDCVDSLGEDPVTTHLLERNGKSRLLEKSADEVIIVDDRPERIDGAFQILDPNEFRDLNAIADYIIITRSGRPKNAQFSYWNTA